MNARQRRRERRIDARITAGIAHRHDLHEETVCALRDIHRAYAKAALEQQFRDMLPDHLKQYAPSVEWR